MDTRHGMQPGDMCSVVVPCAISHAELEQLVAGLYDGKLPLSADNVEAMYRAADAMQVIDALCTSSGCRV